MYSNPMGKNQTPITQIDLDQEIKPIHRKKKYIWKELKINIQFNFNLI